MTTAGLQVGNGLIPSLPGVDIGASGNVCGAAIDVCEAASVFGACSASDARPGVFEDAYLQHASLLRKLATRRFGIGPTEAETLVHDVFATYLIHAEKVRDVKAYLVGAICNASRQYLRRTDTENALFCGDEPCMASPGEALTEEIHRKIVLARALARVGKRCRELLQRYYLQGESTASIAGELDTTPATILVFLHKCRRRARAACSWEAG